MVSLKTKELPGYAESRRDGTLRGIETSPMTIVRVSGKTVALAGSFPGFSQAAIKAQLSALGARVVGSVSGKTDLLFVGGDGGAKQRKAESLGVPIHQKAALFALLEGGAAEPAAPPEPADVAGPADVAEPAGAAAPGGAAASEFAGLTIAVTGKFVTMKRDDVSKLLSEAGAKVGGSVGKKTDLLIYGEKAGSKLSKARTLGVRTMTEAEFIAGLSRSSVESELLEGASDKVAAAEAAERKKLAPVRKTIDAVLAKQRARWGATLGELLLKYIHVLGQRPDVFVYDTRIGAPLSKAGLLAYHKGAPKEWLALASEVNSLEFNWVLAAKKGERHESSKGYNGGRCELVGLPAPGYICWHRIPEWRKEYDDYEAEASFDDFVAEGRTVFSYDPGQRPEQARLVFDDANDCERHELGSLEDYFTDGARAGFVWYWQVGSGGEFRQALLDSSIARDTSPATIVRLLEGKGLTPAEARAMVKWLGDDVVILLHGSETPEGRDRVKLASVFSGYGQASERDMDHALIRSLTEAADPVDAQEWAAICAGHAAFLASGGAGGSWTPLSASGLPLCIYQGGEATEGEQAAFRLKNLDGRDASGVDLSWADLSGASFTGAKFTGASLAHSMAIDALMDGCDFTGANLTGADLSGTTLRGACFRGADLTDVDMEAADLTGADFTGATLTGARFPGAVLDEVVYDD
ncbi:MAG: pentapeptide repeat-containing protein [Myxococcales bacterium]|nr:pentapeptide repeat-containing protein [Myxococcales bacterium]